MIRRWSYVKGTNVDCFEFSRLERRSRMRVFRTSVSYKKFIHKVTKFRRKAVARIKHKTNWVLYNNVIKLWTRDFAFNKHYAKFQYCNKVLLNNFLSYDFNFIKNRSEALFSNFNFILSAWSRKSYFYFRPWGSVPFKNAPITFAWCSDTPDFDKSVVPAYYSWNDQLFPANVSVSADYDINDFFFAVFGIFLKKNIEFRKLLNVLFYFKLNFKNVKWFCFCNFITLENMFASLLQKEGRIFTAALWIYKKNLEN